MLKKLFKNLLSSSNHKGKSDEEIRALCNIDHKRAIDLLMNNKDVYVSTVNQFFELVEGMMGEIDMDIEKRNYDDAVRKVHSLKGVMGMVGAFDMVPFVQQLEKDIKEPVFDKKELNTLHRAVGIVKGNLEKVLEDIKEGTA